MKLAKGLRANDLFAVNIPDSTDEAIRDLCRARTDAVDDLRRAKTRLLALLRRLGFNYDGKTHWTAAHKRYLRHLTLPDAAHNRVLEDNLSTIDFHHERILKLEDAMLQLLEDWQRKPLVEAMMAFKGFKLVAAMVTVSVSELKPTNFTSSSLFKSPGVPWGGFEKERFRYPGK